MSEEVEMFTIITDELTNVEKLLKKIGPRFRASNRIYFRMNDFLFVCHPEESFSKCMKDSLRNFFSIVRCVQPHDLKCRHNSFFSYDSYVCMGIQYESIVNFLS